MGGCTLCKLDFLDFKNEVEHKDVFGNNPAQIKDNASQKSIPNSEFKINQIKMNLKSKLSEIGITMKLDDFKRIIGDDIRNYINSKKLDYKLYLPPTLTYRPNPIQFINGNIYYGNWNEKCEMEGYGIYYLKDQEVTTEGIWKGGDLIFGRIFLPNGDKYEGEISNSVFDGKGTILFSNGDKYKGEFSKGEMNGKGSYEYEDRTIYTGYFKNNLFDGRGKMTWDNGTEYDGNFSDSYLSGNGSIFNLQGEKYVGSFDKNEFNGKGVYTFINGDVYEGDFEYGVKKGNGVYKRNDKVNFSCIWNNDLPDGEGVIEYNNCKVKGYWRNGMMIDNPEIEEGDMNCLNGVDLNIKPCRPLLCILSLPHLGSDNNNSSQYISGKDISFLIK